MFIFTLYVLYSREFFAPRMFLLSFSGLPILLSIVPSLFSSSSVLGITLTTTMNSKKDDNDESALRVTLKPWSDRWKERRIGFHLEEVNPALVKHASSLLPANDETCSTSTTTSSTGSAAATRIFVPLCGKAVDMAYMATSLSTSTLTSTMIDEIDIEIVGLEGIKVALEEFIDEHPGLAITKEPVPSTKTIPFERFVGKKVSLWKGDYFDLEPNMIGRFEAIYDRASIVAIEPELRKKYVQILANLLKQGGRILMVGLEKVASPEHLDAAKKGPPYSISEAELRKFFSNIGDVDDDHSYQVTVLQVTDQLVENPQDRERYAELDKLLETVYLIRKENKAIEK